MTSQTPTPEKDTAKAEVCGCPCHTVCGCSCYAGPPVPTDLAWCGGRHPGACHVPDSTGVCELSTRPLSPGNGGAGGTR